MKHKSSNQHAFTIIELLIATIVFSVVLLLLTTGLIQIGKNYYKGAQQSRTQDAARNIIDEISRGIQFSGGEVKETTPLPGDPVYASATPGSRYGFCINGTGYSYFIDKQLVEATATPSSDQRKSILVSYPVSGGCGSYVVLAPIPAAGVAGSKQLVGVGMRLTDLEVILKPGTPATYDVTVGVATGEDDLFVPNTARNNIKDSCQNSSQRDYCSVSKLFTTVQKRVK